MLADAKAYLKRCDRCQRHAPIVRQPPERLTSISTPIPFAMWGTDILGPFPMASGQRKFIVVAIDYFIKWIEAKFREYCDDNSIELRFTFVAHPQANGQAEVANKIILDGFKKRVERSRNTWVDELLPILWACRTTCKVTTEATPFMLAYGAEVVVPIKITHGSPKIEAYELETNEEGLRLALGLIDEGDLVLRKIEASGVGERGKLAPNWEGPYKVRKTLGRGSYKLETLNGDEVPRTWHASNLKVYYV
ncbi:uncharacterized protein LOC141716834 [Apium graveolens]|uniref:uncharacterized protein LOC141716834 n=1 Tax=Apium graveolens TaxID=4045 RepID=UPI003D79CAB4